MQQGRNSASSSARTDLSERAGRKWTVDGSGLISPAGQVELTSRAARFCISQNEAPPRVLPVCAGDAAWP
ncbi:unnamed protein product [Pleuronectes platessa]|uniref:Uncharacterized protein n=1 Tax=Pleuronectes platessa TaxID=8262 RepID=A0A9N7VM43_PLEPL|nr:unnamed protein product [Pleuronectes platessa]